jgi:hypothetical protein
MTPAEYHEMMQWLGLTHQKIADALGVSKWASVAWRNGRRGIPPMINLALRALVYDRLAGSTVTAAVDQTIAEVQSKAAADRAV